jgi:hypothetical protein
VLDALPKTNQLFQQVETFMGRRLSCVIALAIGSLLATPAFADVIYNNLFPTTGIGVATRPDAGQPFEIEAADDFNLASHTIINTASFIGLIVPGSTGLSSINDIVVEMYRIFPLDSNTTRIPNVPTRANSPSDVAFASRDSAASGELSFASSVLATTFTALNSVTPGGIHPSPGQTTMGNGPITGEEVEIDVTFTTPFDLPADHYFFVPQVGLSGGAQFYWLSANRPIVAPGTPFPTGVTDLQVWTRDAMLDPDWLRVGTDIVGGTTPPTFNAAFSLGGTTVPEPSSILLIVIGFVTLIGLKGFRSN